MKTIATITASLLLSLGLIASPASAEGKPPGTDNPATQLTECGPGAAATAIKAEAALRRAEATVIEMTAINSVINSENTRLARKVARKDARILLLKEKLARARS